ncbi:hypothetical protein Q7P37_011100 [Cladosporium fusiforme]
MHLSNGLQVAITGLAFSQAVLATPVAFPLARSPKPTLQMSPATVAQIGGDHIEAYASNNSALSRRGLEKRSISTTAQKIKCGVNGGGLANYDEGRKRFGEFAGTLSSGMGSAALSVVKVGVQNALCEGNIPGGTCDMIVSAAMQVPGLMFANTLDGYFDQKFDAVREACQANGGSAELIADGPTASDICGIPTCTADGKMGLKVGTFEAQFYIHDGGDTCPANPPKEEVCEITSFN